MSAVETTQGAPPDVPAKSPDDTYSTTDAPDGAYRYLLVVQREGEGGSIHNVHAAMLPITDAHLPEVAAAMNRLAERFCTGYVQAIDAAARKLADPSDQPGEPPAAPSTPSEAWRDEVSIDNLEGFRERVSPELDGADLLELAVMAPDSTDLRDAFQFIHSIRLTGPSGMIEEACRRLDAWVTELEAVPVSAYPEIVLPREQATIERDRTEAGKSRVKARILANFNKLADDQKRTVMTALSRLAAYAGGNGLDVVKCYSGDHGLDDTDRGMIDLACTLSLESHRELPLAIEWLLAGQSGGKGGAA